MQHKPLSQRRPPPRRSTSEVRNRAVQAFWAMHVDAQLWSGLSAAEYANAHRLTTSSLRQWRRRLELKPRFTEDIPRRLWADGEDGKLEDQLTDIVVALAMAGEAQYRQGRRAHHAWPLQRRAENEAELIRRRAEAERLAREQREREAAVRREMLLGQARN